MDADDSTGYCQAKALPDPGGPVRDARCCQLTVGHDCPHLDQQGGQFDVPDETP
jgi:hypothetical protein